MEAIAQSFCAAEPKNRGSEVNFGDLLSDSGCLREKI